MNLKPPNNPFAAINDVLTILQKNVNFHPGNWRSFKLFFSETNNQIRKTGFQSMNYFITKWLNAPLFSLFYDEFLARLALILKDHFNAGTISRWKKNIQLKKNELLQSPVEIEQYIRNYIINHLPGENIKYSTCFHKGRGSLVLKEASPPVLSISENGISRHTLAHEIGHLFYENLRHNDRYSFVYSEITAIAFEMASLNRSPQKIITAYCKYFLNLITIQYRYSCFLHGLERTKKRQYAALSYAYKKYSGMKPDTINLLLPQFWFNTAAYLYAHAFSLFLFSCHRSFPASIKHLRETRTRQGYVSLVEACYSPSGQQRIIQSIKDITTEISHENTM